MNKTAEQLNNVDMRTVVVAKKRTNDLARYGMQVAMLNRLLSHKLVTEKEYRKVDEQLKTDYGIVSF